MKKQTFTNLVRNTTLGLVSMGLLLAGCGGPQKRKDDGLSEGGDVDSSGAPVDPMAVLAQKEKPVRAVSEEERESFAKAAAIYLDVSKDGALSASDCNKAAEAFGDAADDNPKLNEARYNQARVLLECGRQNEAMEIFKKLASGPTPNARAVTNLGVAAWQRGDRAEAERMFIKAIELDPNINSAEARNNLAQILRDRMMASKGNERNTHAGQAIRHLRTVLAIDGNNLKAYASLCHIYFELGLDDMARLVGDQAVRRAAEIATGKYEEEAASNSDQVAAADAKRTGKKAKKGKGDESQTRRVNASVAGTGYTKTMNAHLALVFNTLGLVDLKKKSVSSALANFGRAIEKDPEFFEARMNRAAISLNFRNYGTAEEDFRAVIKQQPNNLEAVIGLGVALRGNRKADEAEQQYVAAIKLNANDARSYYNLGLLYQDYKGGQRPELEKAQQYYRDFSGKSGNGATAELKKDAQKRIKDIDDLFAAFAEAEKMQREFEEMQRKQEQQDKQNQEELKKMQELEKQQGGATNPNAPPAPAAATTPVPAAG
ncbi:MAG: tetratricopeptide repeat protein [Deltaproteobacteria bacterium]|nr:tetratricopeptide repeat protein [Deltaproteobacteria bacterium]